MLAALNGTDWLWLAVVAIAAVLLTILVLRHR
jgi:hypothetical protein